MKEKAIIDFLFQLNDGGLLFLNHYLEEKCGCHVFHISPSDRIIYDGSDSSVVQNLKNSILSTEMEKDFRYSEEDKRLVIRFHVNEFRNLLVFYPVEYQDTDRILSEVMQIDEAIGYYLAGLYLSSVQSRNILHVQPEKIFSQDNEFWSEYCISHGIDLNEMARVIIYAPHNNITPISRARQTITNLSIRIGGSDIQTYQYQDKLIQIVPGKYEIRTSDHQKKEHSFDFPVYKNLKRMKDFHNMDVVISFDALVPMRDIYRSFQSATLGLFYREFFRKKNDVIWLTEDPAFYWFKWDYMEDMITLVTNKYQALRDYESERGGYLFSTLVELVRTRFNYQEAARNLHVHLNTLYYRQDKLSKILNEDFAELETKISLYYEVFLLYFSIQNSVLAPQ